MWSNYDENITENPFYKKIKSLHNDIIEKCAEETWIICIPRLETLETEEITDDIILDHILVPNNEEIFSTLSKKEVTVKDKQIHIEDSYLYTNSIQIHFEETFYLNDASKYVVWCIDRPLFLEYVYCDSHRIVELQTVHDCIDFLFSESLGHEVLDHIQILCQQFITQHEDIELECLQSQKDLIGKLYSQCLQVTFKNSCVTEKTNQSHQFLEKWKVAVETYMQHCLGKKLMYCINTLQWHNDSYLNKIIRNSHHLQLSDLNISNKYCDALISAKCVFSRINYSVTILDKLNCLKKTFHVISGSKSLDKNVYLTSDELLQILVFLILKLNVNNWTAVLVYMKEFCLSSSETSSENSFLITSLEAALEFIKSNEFLNIKNKQAQESSSESSQTLVSYIFSKVRLGDLNVLEDNLKGIYNPNIVDDILCHPLCSCDKCEQNIKKNKIKSDFNIRSCNEKGQNLLIHAIIFNQCHIVEFLLNKNFVVNETDYFGKTALHYAAMKGYQDILLLLINAKVTVNVQDNDKNTPLHLACNYGHENCVKALIYSTPNISLNSTNFYQETPLHLATKWGFFDIVQILVENGALTNIKTKRNMYPVDLAPNYYIVKFLKRFSTESNNNVTFDNVEEEFCNIELETTSPDCKEHGIRPKNVEQLKKVELLLKAIEYNDLPLTCFYLGFNNANDSVSDIDTKCHPLCDCEKCKNLETELDNASNTSITEHININFCNIDGYTALHVAAKFGRVEILRILLDSCALPNVKTYKTLYTPLHIACKYQRTQIVKELLKCGDCNVDAQDAKGNTPLHYACVKNDAKIVEILLSNGADSCRKNFLGKTVLQESEEKMHYRIFKLLKDNYSSVESCDTDDLFC